MKKRFSVFFAACVLCSCLLTSCNIPLFTEEETKNATQGQTQNNEQTQNETDTQPAAEKVDTEKTDIPTDLSIDINTLSVSCSEGSDNCWTFGDNTLTFSGMTANTICSLSGEFDGQIVIDCPEDYSFELELCGVKIYSSAYNPITVLSGKKVTIKAKKESQNYLYDTREAIDETDETSYSAAIFAICDLELAGKGELTVISSHNNGIHTKDDLHVKNLTLSVTCEDNALKGNDSVKITDGMITLIAKTGDGIKTVNTDISGKGNQRGIVSITGGEVVIYAACDGIDAAYDADISEEATIKIYTDCYSPYSESVETTTSDKVRYIRFTSQYYNYSVKYYNSDTDYRIVNATYEKSVSNGRSTYYYYAFDKLTEYSKVQFFLYSSTQKQGQEATYAAKSDYMTWNTAYDTFALEQRGTSLSYSWAKYSSSIDSGMGGPGEMGGGPGGMEDGNTDKKEYSTKGIKAGNEIHISRGTVEIQSYDDAIHANSDTTLGNGNVPTGNVTVSGGILTLVSKDDGIHADGKLLVSGGTIKITGCYEGLEGTTIQIIDGDISVVSSDDGFNATTTSGVGISFEGGNVYIYAGGDGIDSNSRTSYQGILFAGGNIKVVSTTSMNSSIDTEQGYTYTGGTVLALCPSNGMGSESSKCQNFTSIGTKATKSLKEGQTISVKVGGSITTTLTMPCQLSALVIYLGASNATFVTS